MVYIIKIGNKIQLQASLVKNIFPSQVQKVDILKAGCYGSEY